jgi:hypothetical protein
MDTFHAVFARQLAKEAGLGKAILGTLGLGAGAMGLAALSGVRARTATQEEIDQIARSMKLEDVPINRVKPPIPFIPAESYSSDGSVQLRHNSSLGIAAHELAHAQQHQKYQKLLGRRGAEALMNRRPLEQTISSISAWMGKGGVGSLVQAPTLLEEGAASAVALKHIAKNFGARRAAREAIPLAGGFVTYVAQALSPMLFSALKKAK